MVISHFCRKKFTELLPLGFIPFRLVILTLLERIFYSRNCGLVSVQVLEIQIKKLMLNNNIKRTDVKQLLLKEQKLNSGCRKVI